MNAVLQALCTQAKSLTTHSNSPSNTLHPSPVKQIIFQSFGELHSKARFSAHSLTVLFRTMSPWRNVLCLNSYLRLTLGFCIPALLFKSVTDYVCNDQILTKPSNYWFSGAQSYNYTDCQHVLNRHVMSFYHHQISYIPVQCKENDHNLPELWRTNL